VSAVDLPETYKHTHRSRVRKQTTSYLALHSSEPHRTETAKSEANATAESNSAVDLPTIATTPVTLR